MVFETIRKNSAPEMVAEQILKKIKSGELKTGDMLPSQKELALALGVGRSSVREAINALAVMGYLEALQGKGTYVREKLPDTDISIDKLNAAFKTGSMFDLMEARELLECKSATLAAERADKEQIEELKKILEEIEKTNDDYSKFLETDFTFHTKIAEATGNIVIGEMTKLILEKVGLHHSKLRTKNLSEAYFSKSISSIKQIIRFIEISDGKSAVVWMREHLNAIKGELKDIIGNEP